MHPIEERRAVAESIVDNNVMLIDTLSLPATIECGDRGSKQNEIDCARSLHRTCRSVYRDFADISWFSRAMVDS
jgi:hypothetical protein